ncbi:MAG: hypothetical protein V4594_11065 [Bacteroidota bacterium]
MLKTLSYLNIAFALAYFIAYLMNSFSFTMLGVILVIIHSGMVIARAEDERGFSLINYILGGATVVFAAFLGLWAFNIFSAAVANGYLKDVSLYLLLTVPFALSIVVAFLLLWVRKN